MTTSYQAITTAISVQVNSLLSDRTPAPLVAIEKEFEPRESWIGIYCAGETTPAGDQPLAIGRTSRLYVRFDLWAWRFAMTTEAAMAARDLLVADLELALMTDRTFGGAVRTSWLEGGKFNKADDPQNLGRFFAGAETVLVCEIVTTT